MKAIQKDLWCEIRNTRSRFLSILILVALAVAFLSGLRATAPDMKQTCDSYMDRQNFMDIQVLSTLGLTQEDLELLLAQDGVLDAEAAYVIDALAHTRELDIVTKVYSLPERINQLTLTEGRLPQKDGECVVEKNLLLTLDVAIGDSIGLVTSGDYADALHSRDFTIVGTVVSPYYISPERGSSTLGTGSVDAYAYIPAESFDMETYTAAYLTVEGAAREVAFSDAYQQLIDGKIDALEPLGKVRSRLRHDELVGEATEKLDEAQAELDSAKAEADAELADAWQELSDARKELDDGWLELSDAQSTLATESAEAWKEINDGLAQLTDAYIELDQGEQDYADGLVQYEEGLAQYQDGLVQYQEGYEEYCEGAEALALAAGELADASSMLNQAQQQLLGNQANFDNLMDVVLAAVNAPSAEGYPDRESLLASMEADTDASGTRAEVNTALAQLYAVTGLRSSMLISMMSSGDPAAMSSAASALTMALPGANSALIQMGLPPCADAMDLANAMADPSSGSAVCAAVDQTLAAIHSGLEQTDAAGVPTGQPMTASELLAAHHQLQSGWIEFEAGQSSFSEGYGAYLVGRMELEEAKAQLDEAKAELADAKAELDKAEAELADARLELDDGWVSYNDGMQEIADAKTELTQQLAEAEAEINDGLRELREGEVSYNDGLISYQEGKAEAEEKIAEAEAELADARRKVADIDDGQWYILSRESNPGYLGFGQDADRMGSLASVFPVLFFLVAALVCLTTMTRMVEEQRVQIGCLKALGYTRWRISGKYLGYGLLPSLLGSVLGLVIGYTLFPTMIFTAYQIMYDVPSIELHQYTGLSIASIVAAVACTTLSSLAACMATLTDTPANLMRPKAPKPGKRVLLEYIRPLWRRLRFNQKVTARNLLRYQKRFWMTVIGIGGCTALMIAGFGLRSSILLTMDAQYGEIYRYSAQLSTSGNLLESERAEIEAYLNSAPSITASLPCRLSSMTAESDVYSTSAYLEVVDPEEIGHYVELRTLQHGEPLHIPDDGVIIDQKLSELLELEIGSRFTLDGDTRTSVTVAGITEHYLSHFVYMSPEYYEQVFGESVFHNAYLLTLQDEEKKTADAVFAELMQFNGVTSATRMADTRDTYQHSMERIDFVVVIVILCAAALAMVVLFNLSNINITERRRELATIKVLGFYDREVAAYVNRENVILTMGGILMGILFGHVLHVWLIHSVEIDLMMFGRDTDPMAYLWSALLTALFSTLVNLAAARRMKKIDMVESLKSAE